MLIPAISADPAQCTAIPDAHVVKLIAETLQIVSTAAPAVLSPAELGPIAPMLTRPTHAHHPYTRWATESRDNVAWLIQLGRALCDEKRRRWPENQPHQYAVNFATLAQHVPPPTTALSEHQLPAVCTSATSVPDERHRRLIAHLVARGRRARAFQLYYHVSKQHLWRFGGAAETRERQVAKRTGRPACTARFVPSLWADFVLTADEQAFM